MEDGLTDAQATPAKIAAAIIAIKKQVKLLGSDEKNEHGGYRYVSVDKFYERIGRVMAEAGLALLIDETETDVRISETTDRNGTVRKTPWLYAQYSLTFLHESGEVSRPMRRSLAMPIAGPQAYGAAQSYVEKQFLRQIFKIPTGEKDADDTAQEDQEGPTRPPSRTPPPPGPPPGVTTAPVRTESAQATAARQRVRMLINQYQERILTAPHQHALENVAEDGAADLEEIERSGTQGAAAAKELRRKWEVRMREFEDGSDV